MTRKSGTLRAPSRARAKEPAAKHATATRATKASERIARELTRRIVRGELKEGDALPAEATLMKKFGVSRPTMREAFRILEAEQLISVSRGSRGGARVHLPELDVVARRGDLIVVVEVRARGASSWTTGFGSLNGKKRYRVRLAGQRLWQRRYRNDPTVNRLRFDAASVVALPSRSVNGVPGTGRGASWITSLRMSRRD